MATNAPAAPAPNAFDDITAQAAASLGANTAGNAFDDITPPPPKPKVPVTAADRVQAGEAGILKGSAYLASMPADLALNVENLARASEGYMSSVRNATTETQPLRTPGGLYHAIWPDGSERYSKDPPPEGSKPASVTTNPIPAWADPAKDPTLRPFAAGQAVTELMDQSPITTTQVARPDDPASRYIAAAASTVPGVLAGGGSVGQTVRALTAAVPGAMASEAVAEHKPFQSEAANNAAATLAQALTTKAAGTLTRGPGAPLPQNQVRNDAVLAGQKVGYEFPPATTNPSIGNRTLESIAGKIATQQHAAINNQGVTNEGFREDLNLPRDEGGAVTGPEIQQAKLNAAPGYDALRGAGQIQVPTGTAAKLAAALSKSQGAARLSPSLGADSQLESVAGDLQKLGSFDAGDGMDTIALLRERANTAYQNGEATTGKAYRSLSNTLEDAIDQHLSSQPNTADLLQNYRDSRRQFAQIASYEDARNVSSGNIDATKLANALQNNEKLSGRALVAAQAAGQAKKAFTEPASSPASHTSALAALIAGMVAAHEALPGKAGLATGAAMAAVPLTRMGARSYALGPGQVNALPRGPAPLAPGVLPGAYTGGATVAGGNP